MMNESISGKLGNKLIIGAIVVFILLVVINTYRNNKNSLYMVYACNEAGRCYALKADVTTKDGQTSIDRFYFNNGGSVELDCTLGENNDCYETSTDTDSPMHWQIKQLLERIGDRRR